ncbi:MAG TPA: hypothetical protein VKV28_04060 [Candidatus Binataceae bacterium]|nr:hypothetical protein [Candidatus Binataceae bacterium]
MAAHGKTCLRLGGAKQQAAVSARVELDIQLQTRREPSGKSVYSDALEQVSWRPLYRNRRWAAFASAKGQELVEVKVPSGERWLRPEDAIGNVRSFAGLQDDVWVAATLPEPGKRSSPALRARSGKPAD